MRKTLLVVGTLTAIFYAALAFPATAQMMCGSGQQAQGSAGMMCGMMGRQAQEAQPQPQSGMCSCCRNMATMGPQQPSMQMPKQ